MGYLWLGIWVLMVAASLAAHEAGHVVVGRCYGWDYGGLKLSLRGPKVVMGHRSPDPKDWNLGRVALAGPLATLLACAVFIGLSLLPIDNAWVFDTLAALNFTIFVINLLPLPITDGGHILFAVTGWRMRWRYTAAPWLAAEVLVALWLVFRSLIDV
jgi:membrane-associated protease RseP (regulator of RpoE activity)